MPPTFRVLAASLLALAGLVPVVGCSTTGAGSKVIETFDVDVFEPTVVDVEAFAGDVVVVADERLERGTVTAWPRTIHEGRSADAAAAIDAIDLDVRLVPTETGPVLRIRSTTVDPQPRLSLTDLRIELPFVSDVRIRTGRGDVDVLMMRGSADVETDSGNARIRTELPMTEAVRMVSLDGDVDYRVRGESTGRITAESIGGQVLQRVAWGRVEIHPGSDRDSLVMIVNGGENPVDLRAVDGDVRIAIIADPMAQGAMRAGP